MVLGGGLDDVLLVFRDVHDGHGGSGEESERGGGQVRRDQDWRAHCVSAQKKDFKSTSD